MSGGYYNYLYCAYNLGELMSRTSDIESMAERLGELGHSPAAAACDVPW
ncbi:hypothetical protein GCM10022221_68190 [Actinocorallia aurea]